MKKRATQYVRGVVLGVLVSSIPFVAYAQGGLQKTAQASGLVNYGSDPLVIAGNIISALLAMTSVFFFILMIYAGFKWMLSRGNDESVAKAKHTISAAIIGMIIIFASYAITKVVINTTSGNAGALGGTAGTNPSGQQGGSCVASQTSMSLYISTGVICSSLAAQSCEQPQTIDCEFVTDSLGGTCVAVPSSLQTYSGADTFCSQFSELVDCEALHTIQCVLN